MLGAALRSVRRLAIVMGVSFAMAAVAHAAPITYTINGIASGHLGATTFDGAPFTITAIGDTANVTTPWPGVPCNDLTSVTFTISGVGSGSIISRLSIAENTGMQLLALALERCVDAGLIWTSGYDARFTSYDLTTGIGPVALATPSSQSGVEPTTSGGTLTLTQVTSLTFQATAGAAIVPVVGLWWNPGESGSGYNLDVKNGVLVVTVFSYKANGEPQWYITSGPIVDNSFAGTLNKYVAGQCIACPYRGLPTSAGNDGEIAIEFSSPTSATLWLPGGRVTQIQPQAF